ncbi:thioredoxin fold domain-containing protein [Pseudomonas sp. MYb185]|uniref:thioredoxin fold domain-containing protein n=1 Tax=Pseudomonas sp. MYb185 TaxID=1848729 RepID=UPI000CFCAFA1|nr:thioredoxin fold domain-containing protein [Pseudomonas sp. MYb185]PRB81524.1 protein-disulfide isomerase [Pseudomonas sp. MYb185]
MNMGDAEARALAWAGGAMLVTLPVAALIAGVGSVFALWTQLGEDNQQQVEAVLPIVESRLSPVLGLNEARLQSGERVYISHGGNFFLVGNLFQVTAEGVVNLTEIAHREDRLGELASVPEDRFLSFIANDERAVVTVFTDTSCPYCQLLHREVAKLNELGITVRYLAFPRAGLNSTVASQMQSVWCSSQPENALEQAFQGGWVQVDQNTCSGAAISTGFELGQRFGVRGTPAVVLPNGELGEGYMSAAQLAEAISASSAGSESH